LTYKPEFAYIDITKSGFLSTNPISRIENHAEDIRLSTLVNYAQALGKQLHLEVA